MPAIGWKGYARVGSSGILPYTSSDISEITELMPSEAIQGGGINAVHGIFPSRINYAIGRKMAQGRITGEVFGGTGSFATAFRALLERAIGATSSNNSLRETGFTSSNKLIFSPGGGIQVELPKSTAAQPKAVVSQFTLNGNNGGIVTFDANIIGTGADRTNSPANAPAIGDLAYEPGGLTDDNNPVPYYASNFTVTGSGEASITDRITDWTITVNNNSNPIYAFNGDNAPADILQGKMVVTGSFTYYSPSGTFVEDLTHGATLSITFGTIILKSDHLGFGRAPIPAPNMNAPAERRVEFECFASASNASLFIQ